MKYRLHLIAVETAGAVGYMAVTWLVHKLLPKAAR